MPLNTLRLNNTPSSHPNERIVFIKALQRPVSEHSEHETADTYLRAIAAQCMPIMKSNWLSVTTLEEHEPNREFIGRNFNNGEIIQLVLRSRNGSWLPFNMVQMVMMHELAHNMHMNHGKQFWESRNKFAGELRALWTKGYTGEGFWGSGRALDDFRQIVGNNSMTVGDMQDVQVCGGTFRSRRRKRKRAGVDNSDLTWKEKRDRRIEKKFGKNGQTLGEDELHRMALETRSKGGIGGKPRVAQSKRGRELRAAAALARFESNKRDSDEFKKEGDPDDSADEYEEDVAVKEDDAIDTNGQRLVDHLGFGMVRVCERGDNDDVHVKHEMDELDDLAQCQPQAGATNRSSAMNNQKNNPALGRDQDEEDAYQQQSDTRHASIYDIPQYRASPTPPPTPIPAISTTKPKPAPKISIKHLTSATPGVRNLSSTLTSASSSTPSELQYKPVTLPQSARVSCRICSLENEALNATCTACSNVLDPRKDSRHWICSGDACRESEYVNSGDVGICGLCGARKAGV